MKTDKKIYAEGKWRKCHISDWGYLRFALNGKTILVHRYLYEQHHQCCILPGIHCHHKDGDKLNNHLDNLELIHGDEHTFMHKFKGGSVSFKKERKKWVVQVQENKKRKYLGLFNTQEEAQETLNNYYSVGEK